MAKLHEQTACSAELEDKCAGLGSDLAGEKARAEQLKASLAEREAALEAARGAAMEAAAAAAREEEQLLEEVAA